MGLAHFGASENDKNKKENSILTNDLKIMIYG